jgi:hypothetical protein
MKDIYEIKITTDGVEYSLLARLHCLLGLNFYKLQSEKLETKRRQTDEYRT